MLWDILLRVIEPTNLVVISKKLLIDKEAVRVISALNSGGRNVLLVQPNDKATLGKLFHTPGSISEEKPIDEIVDDTSSSSSWETDTDGEIDAED
ncbi:unnamed protein product [Arabidopsis halleri]